VKGFETLKTFDGTVAGTLVQKGDVIFPRIDVEKKLEELEEIRLENLPEEDKVVPMAPIKPEITFEEFEKVDLRLAKVLSAEKVKKSKKLLKLKVKLGSEERQIISGIAQFYQPDELIGKMVVIVANLKPAKLMGRNSEGMILSAANEEDTVLFVVGPEGELPDGSSVR
jgi:methionyl-tRNA synthetase